MDRDWGDGESVIVMVLVMVPLFRSTEYRESVLCSSLSWVN